MAITPGQSKKKLLLLFNHLMEPGLLKMKGERPQNLFEAMREQNLP